jgi:ankyrin repeat protein
VPCTRYLLSNGSHVNFQDSQGMTALHFAVTANSEVCVKLLCEAGASVDILNYVGSRQTGMSPFDYAESMRLNVLRTAMRRYSKSSR